MGYRFRFYGRRPKDWHEGANRGHAYEIGFRAAPSAELKARLARLAEEHFATGPAELDPEPWLWAAHVAAFAVGERWRNAAPMVFSQVTDFAVAVHELAPLAQVVFWGVREEGEGAWDVWTRANQPVPDPGPAYAPPRVLPFGRPIDPALGTAAADASFEAARAAARQAIADRRAQAATRQALATCTKSGLSFVATDLPIPEAKPTFEDPLLGPAPAGCAWFVRPGPPVHAILLDAKTQARKGLAVRGEAGTLLVQGFAGWPGDPAFSADGRFAITACKPEPMRGARTVELVDLEALTHRPLWTAPEDIVGVGRLEDGNWLVKTVEQLVVLDGTADTNPAVLATLGHKNGAGLVVAHGGACIACVSWPHLDVFGYCLGALKKLGRLAKVQPNPIWVTDGSLHAGVGGKCVTLAGFEAAFEAWAGPLRAKMSKGRRA
ncbi:MAG TPA: hypothetical protein PK668_28310 [Myxococcota bacterium]|nr:hypothetical protein [Myxococcota bacterium]HRY97407.1 hypothetical protein [Myxococcota bacterium]HSA24168.1 hypothetical protein [Myxococcota bacterium]